MHMQSFMRLEKAIKSGFQERALSILRAEEHYFSKKELQKVYKCAESNAAILKYLLELSPVRDTIDVAANDNRIIRRASENGHKEVVKLLLDRGSFNSHIDPSVGDNCAIRMASENGHVQVVKLLLDYAPHYSIDPAADDNYAIRYASYYGHTEIVKILLACDARYKIDPSAENNFAIAYANSGKRHERSHGRSHEKEVKILLKHDSRYRGIDPSAERNVLIIRLSAICNIEMIKILLTHDDVDPTTNYGEVLHFATMFKKMEKMAIFWLADPRLRAKRMPKRIFDAYENTDYRKREWNKNNSFCLYSAL